MRVKKIKTIFLNLITRARLFLFVDKDSKRFIAHNKHQWRDWKIWSSQKVVLIDYYSGCETNIARSYFVNVLAKKKQALIKSFGPHDWWYNRTLRQVYRSFNVCSHLFTSLTREQKEKQERIYQEITPKLKTKKDVFRIKILGIWIGIDIYETYLKHFHRPTIFLNDQRLFKTIKKGIGLTIFWQEYFEKNNVVAIVNTHDCYLDFNVVCKVAYQHKVPVYFPNPIYMNLVKKPQGIHGYFSQYPKMFNKLSVKEKGHAMQLAKKQLRRRLKGEIGIDRPYSQASAFKYSRKEKRVLEKNKKTKVLICTHCFYDNPHAFGKIFFTDFYEWLCYLGKISQKTNYDWYIKVHPDPLPGTIKTVKEIIKHYPAIKYLPNTTSHNQLSKEGLDFALTVYGSVGHEYPALNVQVINAGYNPHIAYSFNWHPRSLKEYEYYLLNLNNLKKKKISLNDLYEFYYMHHYYRLDDDLVFLSYRQLLIDKTPRERVKSTVFSYFLNQLNHAKHKEIIKKMQEFIDSRKLYYFSHGSE